MRFHSLKTRLILPLLGVTVVATSFVAIASYGWAERATTAQLDQRFGAIQRAIEQTNFPLSRAVLRTLSELTSAHWVSLRVDGEILDVAIAGSSRVFTQSQRHRWSERLRDVSANPSRGPAGDVPVKIRIESETYYMKRFPIASGNRRAGTATYTAAARSDTLVSEVVVMFDDADWRDIRRQAAVAPLMTGLSTILLLSSVTLYLTSRLVLRLKRLQREVESIAQGDFSSRLASGSDDEVGRLGQAVETMALQLRQMWDALRREHGQRLLHQIAGGLAHNLRNSLTGARMAVELHQREYRMQQAERGGTEQAANQPGGLGDDGLRVAIEQLEHAERYVHRLLLASKGKHDIDRPATVEEVLRGVMSSLDSTARHLEVLLEWDIDAGVGAVRVTDGPTLTSALTNLVWNAIQAGNQVAIHVRKSVAPGGEAHVDAIQIEVIDDGPGPPPEVADSIFDPLVTTKPDGLGLGLPLVKRAAESLGGEVRWVRRGDFTVFTLTFPVR